MEDDGVIFFSLVLIIVLDYPIDEGTIRLSLVHTYREANTSILDLYLQLERLVYFVFSSLLIMCTFILIYVIFSIIKGIFFYVTLKRVQVVIFIYIN